MSEKDKQSIRADEYEEQVKYAPGWPPQPKQSVDPSVHATLDSITDHGPTKAQYITQIKEALQKVHDPEITIDIYNLGLIYDVKVTEDKALRTRASPEDREMKIPSERWVTPSRPSSILTSKELGVFRVSFC